MSPKQDHQTTARELRQRRARIIKDTAEEMGKEKRVHDNNSNKNNKVRQSTGKSSVHAIRIVVVAVTAVVISVSAVLQYTRPQFFQRIWKRRNIPPFYFATKYPNNVILERDLPRFFQSLSIATRENEFARQAVQKVTRSRTRLKDRLDETKIILKAWDAANVNILIRRGLCGEEFTEAHFKGTDQRKEDLLMWCLLATRVVEGFFQESVEMIDSAIFLTRKRGIVVKKQPPAGKEDGYGALSTSFYLHPRLNTTFLQWIPHKVLAMVISTPEAEMGSPSEARDVLERYLYDLVISQDMEDDYLVLDEVCQNDLPERAIGIDCPNGELGGCCYFVVPEKYGGSFDLSH